MHNQGVVLAIVTVAMPFYFFSWAQTSVEISAECVRVNSKKSVRLKLIFQKPITIFANLSNNLIYKVHYLSCDFCKRRLHCVAFIHVAGPDAISFFDNPSRFSRKVKTCLLDEIDIICLLRITPFLWFKWFYISVPRTRTP